MLAAVQTRSADDLASLIAAPKFDANRVVKEISTLARSLTRIERESLAGAPDAKATLRALRDALDALLDE